MGAADVHLDRNRRGAVICGDVNAISGVNDEGLVDSGIALEELTGIQVGHALLRPLDCGMLGLQLDMHGGLAGGRVKGETAHKPGSARRSTRQL